MLSPGSTLPPAERARTRATAGRGGVITKRWRRLCALAHDCDMQAGPIVLVDVRQVMPKAVEVVALFARDFVGELANAEVHHIGATSLPFGHTNGDVDVNVPVDQNQFSSVVTAFRARLAVAQPDNWTPTFASFSSDAYVLPLGVQVTVFGSPYDFLLALRDRMRADPALLRRYDDAKVAAAKNGADAYWMTKDTILRELIPK